MTKWFDQTNTPLITVLVPVYNLEDYVDKCVDSLVNQTYQSLEILLLDDGSTDGSTEKCRDWEKRDARVRCIRLEENIGQAAAKNIGMDQAKGDCISFVDGDDWVLPDLYETMIHAMRENRADVGGFTFNYVFPDRQISLGDSGSIRAYTRKEAMEQLYMQKDVRFESTLKLYDRQVFKDARFVTGQLFEEIHFARETLQKMERYVYVDRAFYQYLQCRYGNTNSSFPEKKLLVIEECNAFAEELRQNNMEKAALGMESFTLDHLIRMYVNARACHADRNIVKRIESAYRKKMLKNRHNPMVRKARGWLFALSPMAYDWLSQRLHSRL